MQINYFLVDVYYLNKKRERFLDRRSVATYAVRVFAARLILRCWLHLLNTFALVRLSSTHSP